MPKQNGLKLAYRLPAQSEWDIAARAGAAGWQYWGRDKNHACEYANVFDETATRTLGGRENREDYQCSDGYIYTAPVARGLRPVLHVSSGHRGSWETSATDSHPYSGSTTDEPQDHLGFRIARTL